MVLSDQGNHDFAIEKFDEAMRHGGIEAFSLECQERYGALLEELGRVDDAINVLAAVRRQDLHYRNVNTRIENLKRDLSAANAEEAAINTRSGDGSSESVREDGPSAKCCTI